MGTSTLLGIVLLLQVCNSCALMATMLSLNNLSSQIPGANVGVRKPGISLDNATALSVFQPSSLLEEYTNKAVTDPAWILHIYYLKVVKNEEAAKFVSWDWLVQRHQELVSDPDQTVKLVSAGVTDIKGDVNLIIRAYTFGNFMHTSVSDLKIGTNAIEHTRKKLTSVSDLKIGTNALEHTKEFFSTSSQFSKSDDLYLNFFESRECFKVAGYNWSPELLSVYESLLDPFKDDKAVIMVVVEQTLSI